MNFLVNKLGKGNRQQLTKYDRLQFKFSTTEHIPQYYQTIFTKIFIDKEITQEHPLYCDIFPKKKQIQKKLDYIEYQVKEQDSMFGIAIKLDISEQFLRNINGIRGSLYPGMIIKLPNDIDLSKLEEKVKQQQPRPQVSSSFKLDNQNNNKIYQYNVYYFAGPSGYIKGILTLTSNSIIFNPLLEDQQNLSKFPIEKLQKFNVMVQMADIQKVQSLPITSIHKFSQNTQQRFHDTVQLMLYKIGNEKIQKKYKQRLKQLKMNHQAIAYISFSFHHDQQKQIKQMIQTLNKIIANNKQIDDDDQNKKRLTNLPYYDVINDQIMLSLKSIQSIEQHHVLTNSIILGSLSDNSDIISPTQFQYLIKHFPLLYKLYNWQRAFSARRDGTSFPTFLKKSKNVQPAIFLLKQYKGNILGAFLVENIQPGKTGRGQMFIFTFRHDSNQPDVYQWTTKNDFFVFLDTDQGIGIGMGIKYGIFVNRNLEKGCSASTITFGNKYPLSVKEDFQIDEVQLWGVDGSF